MPSLDVRTIQDLEVVLWDQSIRRLGELWEREPLVLVFLRHYG
jgi:hypothetical protein